MFSIRIPTIFTAFLTVAGYASAQTAPGTVRTLYTPGEPWTERIVHTFSGYDGIWPNGGLLIQPDGLLYGTTYGRDPVEAGGGPRYGTVYSLQP